MLGDVDEISRRNFRPARGWNRPGVSASRKRDRPERRRDRETVRAPLAALRALESRRRNDVQVERKLFHVSRLNRQGFYPGRDPLFPFECSVPQTTQLYFR